jgi:hypothetical protein
MLQPSSEYSLFALNATGVAVMIINEYQMAADATGGWVAIAGPACTPQLTTSCSYDLLALQVGLSDFIFDSLSWTDGLIELPKPMPVVDNGNGILIPEGSTFVASFVVGGQKRVVSQGTTFSKIWMSPDETKLTLTIDGQLRLPFGGYTVDGMSITVSGALAAH